MISSVLWDNDGVLVDTERIFFEVNRDFFRLHRIELTEKNFFDWFLCDNCGAWHLLRERGISHGQIDRHRQQRDELYTARLRSERILSVPGVADVLGELSKRVRMGVVTSASRQHFDAIHQDLDLAGHFEFVLTAETYTSSKPSPEPYLLGLTRLNVSRDECLVVEDSPRGLQAAMAAGIKCIILRNAMTRHYSFDGAFRVVDTMNEVRQEIERLL
jgi:HAD superfamily hydrolase (TIGR01509 family)